MEDHNDDDDDGDDYGDDLDNNYDDDANLLNRLSYFYHYPCQPSPPHYLNM